MSYFEKTYGAVSYPRAGKGDEGLRRAQEGALHAIGAHFSLQTTQAIVVMPTGSGKTAVLMLTAFQQCANRVLVITPSRLVRNQITEDFSQLATLRKIGAIPKKIKSPKVLEVSEKLTSAEEWEKLRAYDVIVATPNSISPLIPGVALPPPDLFDMLLVDEAHHSPAKTWNELLAAFPKAKKVLFTATPFRRDKREIIGRFVYEFPLKEAARDEIFGKVNYVPVDDEGQDPDVAIAREAERVLIEDREKGFNHYLMVRTDRKTRAKELVQVYHDHTSLNLLSIDSDKSYASIQQAITKLKSNDLDGIICVNMLGEGFDFPNLKIAAIHAPHKSLEVTLQFIGRFARTNAKDIGQASFLASPNNLEIEAERLYDEGAVWQEMVVNLSAGRIEKEKLIREGLEQFEPPTEVEVKLEDISMYSLKPYNHVKIFQVRGKFDVHAEPVLPASFAIALHRVSPDASTVMFIAKERQKPRWTNLEVFASTEYALFVVYFDQKAKLLFINASCKNEPLYKAIATSFVNGHCEQLPVHRVSRVMAGMTKPRIFNLGLRVSRVSGTGETYRISAGPEAEKSVTKSQGRSFVRGHVSGTAFIDDKLVNFGYSSSAKAWDTSNSFIPELIEWCQTLAARISGTRAVQTGSALDYLPTAKTITRIPRSLIAVSWDPDVYAKPTEANFTNQDGLECACPLQDLEITFDRPGCTADKIPVVVTGPGFKWHCEFSLNNIDPFSATEPDAIKIRRGHRVFPLVDYLNDRCPSFHFADFSMLLRRDYYENSVDLPFDRNAIEVIEWEKENVDITQELGDSTAGPRSIQQYLKEQLPKQNVDIVFHDHGTGEMADFLTFKCSDEEVHICLYHCKGSGGAKAGLRVDDVYEVCGQVVKCLVWLGKPRDLHDRLTYRHKQVNRRCIHGDKGLLDSIMAKAKTSHKVRYELVLVQPGISRSRLPANQANVLAAANDYISDLCLPLRILASA